MDSLLRHSAISDRACLEGSIPLMRQRIAIRFPLHLTVQVVLQAVTEPIPLKTDSDGVIRVGGTRVTLDTLVAAYQEGATAEEMAEQYPSIKLADVYATLGYYLHHRAEVDAYLAEGKAQSSKLREGAERRHGPWPDLRARLQSRGQSR